MKTKTKWLIKIVLATIVGYSLFLLFSLPISDLNNINEDVRFFLFRIYPYINYFVGISYFFIILFLKEIIFFIEKYDNPVRILGVVLVRILGVVLVGILGWILGGILGGIFGGILGGIFGGILGVILGGILGGIFEKIKELYS